MCLSRGVEIAGEGWKNTKSPNPWSAEVGSSWTYKRSHTAYTYPLLGKQRNRSIVNVIIAAMRSSWIKLKVWSGQVAHLFHSAIQICPSRHGPCRERIRSFTRSLIVGKQLDMTHVSIVSRVERIEKRSTNLIQRHFTSLASWNSSFMDEHVSTTTHEHCLTHSTSVHIFESQSAVWSSPGGFRGFQIASGFGAYGSMLILQISL